MSSRQRVALVIWGALVAVTATCEQRLSDIGGSIELVRPAGEQIVVVEPTSPDPSARVAVTGSDLVDMTQSLLEAGRDAAAILGETRTSLAFFDDGWRRRMADALVDIESARASLELASAPDRYAGPLGRVEDGARHLQAAAGIVRWAVVRDQALVSGAFEHLAAGNREIAAALVEMRSDVGVERSESASQPPDSFDGRQTAARLCGAQFGASQPGDVERCVARQVASLEAMQRRFSFTVGIDELTFNAIRNGCRAEWPDDLVARDRCEQRRMSGAAAR